MRLISPHSGHDISTTEGFITEGFITENCTAESTAESTAENCITESHDLIAIKVLPLVARAGLSLVIALTVSNLAVAQALPLQMGQRVAQQVSPPGRQAGQQVLYVNPATGNDTRADGSQRSPFRTITQALQVARSNTVIQLAEGTYSAQTGETFPLVMKPGVTIQGNADSLGKDIVILGGGTFLSRTSARQDVALLGANQATLIGVTITNPDPRGYGLWLESSNPTIISNTFTGNTHDGISAVGSSSPLIRNNLFVLNGANGMTIYGTSQPEVRENVFIRTGFAINIAENAAPRLIENRISQNRDGVVVHGDARPVLRGNTIEDSERDGLVAIAQSQPDLGTSTESGNNTFVNSGRYDLNAAETTYTLPASGNQLRSDRTVGKIDLTGNAPLVPAVAAANRFLSSPTRSNANPPAQSPVLISVLPPHSSNQAASNPTASSQAASSPSRSASNQASSPSSSSQTVRPARTPVRPAAQTSQNTEPKPAAVNHTLPAVEISVPPSRSARSGATTPPSPASTSAIEISVPPPSRSPQRFAPSTAQQSQTRSSAVARTSSRSDRSSRTPSTLSASARTSSARTSSAVEISVPPPANPSPQVVATASTIPSVSSTVSVPRSNGIPRQAIESAYRAAPTVSAPIEIPVPPPEPGSSSQVPPPPPSQNSSGNSRPTPGTNIALLPVPGGEIPVGNTGDLPRISASGASRRNTSQTFLVARRESLRYRVVVVAGSDLEASLVRSIVPNAFPTSDDQAMMQVGAFSSRDNAEETVELLSQNGLRAMIQPIE